MKDFFSLSPVIRLRLLMMFLGAMTFSTVGGSMTIYYNEHMGSGVTGILLIISNILTFVVGLWAGHLSDLRGRRPIMLFSTLVTTTGAGIATFANSPVFFNPWVTYFGFLILFFGYGFFNTAATAMMVDLTTSENRRLVYSLQYWVINMAILIGSALSGWFFRDYLMWLLLACALEEFLSFWLVYFFIAESFDPVAAAKKAGMSIFKAYRMVAGDRAFMWYCLSAIFTAMIFNQLDNYLPVHLSNSFVNTSVFGLQIYGQRMLSIFLIVNTFIIVLLMNGLTRLTRNWRRQTGMVVGLFFQGTGFIVAFLGTTLTVELVATVIATFGEMIGVSFLQAYRADLMEGDSAGTYSGFFTITQPIASVISGLLVSVSGVLTNVGMAGMMVLVMIGAIWPAIVSVRMKERPKEVLSS
ncbi:MAG: MFS transporter [Streptococcaceae bacterium]|nr:MFS transporter [Streptococcaceae bacterium]